MNTTISTRVARRSAAAIAGLGFVALAGACSLELDSDRAAARRVAVRIERSIEQHDDAGTIDIPALETAINVVVGGVVLEDIVDEDAIAVIGLDDADGDGHDDDGRFELTINDATACLTFRDTDAEFELRPC